MAVVQPMRKGMDISNLNKKFYEAVKKHFEGLLPALSPFKDENKRAAFAIRLINNIIFCWFLKGEKQVEGENYYEELLKLFSGYELLNSEYFDASIAIDNNWFRSFFDTLEAYDFCIDESRDEIAIDPGMPGTIFENLLAELNHETGNSARKTSGSYYTPRAIADYMAQQAITRYLENSVGNSTLVSQFVCTNKLPGELTDIVAVISKALNEVKVLDPACGSGAFLISVLQKLVALKREIWKLQNPNGQISDKIIYRLKLATLQHSIFGIDIQPMAIELSRLRCWMNLVASKETLLPKDTLNFCCTDSLIYDIKHKFDIVIGNPPYIPIAKLPLPVVEKLEQQHYQTFTKGADIYCLFYEQGMNWLKEKGVLCFLSSNRFCYTNYGEGLRKYLSEKNILQAIDFNDANLFDSANVGSVIILVENDMIDKNPVLVYQSQTADEDWQEAVVQQGKYLQNIFFSANPWSFDNNETQSLKFKIEGRGIPFSKWEDISINRGITTGLNDVFIIDEATKTKIISEDPNSEAILKPILKGANIKRYSITAPKEYLVFTYAGIDIDQYPGVYKYLFTHKARLENVYEAKHGLKKWYELRKCRYYEQFSQSKLVWTRLSGKNAFSISLQGELSVDSSSFAVSKDIKYLAAVLNSSVVFFYFKSGSVIWGKDGIKWFGNYFDQIPVPPKKDGSSLVIETIVDYVLAVNKSKARISEEISNERMAERFEALIDACVYELYFEKEIKEKEADVLTLISKQFKSISGSAEEEQVKIIRKGYEMLTNKGGELYQRISNQKQVEEVATIQNNLKQPQPL